MLPRVLEERDYSLGHRATASVVGMLRCDTGRDAHDHQPPRVAPKYQSDPTGISPSLKMARDRPSGMAPVQLLYRSNSSSEFSLTHNRNSASRAIKVRVQQTPHSRVRPKCALNAQSRGTSGECAARALASNRRRVAGWALSVGTVAVLRLL